MHVTGPLDGHEGVKPGIAVTDLMTGQSTLILIINQFTNQSPINQLSGLYAHGAIMAALVQRSITGKGDCIDANLLRTQVCALPL